MSRAVKTKVLGIRFTVETLEALHKAADAERRAMSALVGIIVTDWLTTKGFGKAEIEAERLIQAQRQRAKAAYEPPKPQRPPAPGFEG